MGTETKFEKLIDDEVQRILAQQARRQASTLYLAQRVLYRFARVGLGLFLGLLGLWFLAAAIDLTGKPLGAMTLRDLFMLLVQSLAGVALMGTALTVAFGALKSDYESPQELRARAERLVDEKLRQAKLNAEKIDSEQRESEKWYRHGKLVGLLFDKQLEKRHPWLPWVAVPATYAFLAALIWLLA
jgi:hypothetical protein